MQGSSFTGTLSSANVIQVTRGAAPPGLRALVVDDEPAVRSAIARALFERVDVIHASDGEEASRLLRAGGAFDMLLFDLALPGRTGIELLAEAMELWPLVPRALMSGALAPANINAALAFDAVFVAKPFDATTLRVLLAVMEMRTPARRASAATDLRGRLAALGLSPREIEVFAELATGATAEVAALRLNISPSTVRSHCARVYERLRASSLAEVIARANGWR